ncbi:hypothetical protein [Mangrovimonas cancribranchiae]|uniref:Uncharacterized protein n=1 Tax=Mangrovimonas cancribranchiae TaxID=3080055 RepID=A0AAU6NWX9_9FLAO
MPKRSRKTLQLGDTFGQINKHLQSQRKNTYLNNSQYPRLKGTYPYINNTALKLTLGRYRTYVNLWAKRVKTENKAVKTYNHKVKAYLEQNPPTPAIQQAINNFGNRRVNGKKLKHLSPRVYNFYVEAENKNNKALLIQKRNWQRINQQTDEVFLCCLFQYNKLLKRINKTKRNIANKSYQYIPKLDFNSSEIKMLTNNGERILRMTNQTIRNHRKRLEEAHILRDYSFHNHETGVKVHFNNQILVAFCEHERELLLPEHQRIDQKTFAAWADNDFVCLALHSKTYTPVNQQNKYLKSEENKSVNNIVNNGIEKTAKNTIHSTSQNINNHQSNHLKSEENDGVNNVNSTTLTQTSKNLTHSTSQNINNQQDNYLKSEENQLKQHREGYFIDSQYSINLESESFTDNNKLTRTKNNVNKLKGSSLTLSNNNLKLQEHNLASFANFNSTPNKASLNNPKNSDDFLKFLLRPEILANQLAQGVYFVPPKIDAAAIFNEAKHGTLTKQEFQHFAINYFMMVLSPVYNKPNVKASYGSWRYAINYFRQYMFRLKTGSIKPKIQIADELVKIHVFALNELHKYCKSNPKFNVLYPNLYLDLRRTDKQSGGYRWFATTQYNAMLDGLNQKPTTADKPEKAPPYQRLLKKVESHVNGKLSLLDLEEYAYKNHKGELYDKLEQMIIEEKKEQQHRQNANQAQSIKNFLTK